MNMEKVRSVVVDQTILGSSSTMAPSSFVVPAPGLKASTTSPARLGFETQSSLDEWPLESVAASELASASILAALVSALLRKDC